MESITAKEFDEKFDNNEDISDYLDWDRAKRIHEKRMRVSVDFPRWMVQSLDRESTHLGISRQALIKLSVAEHIKQQKGT